jgi:DNA-binding IclR family transcriptional regulator
VTVAAPFLQELNNEFGEAVTLYERVGQESVVLDRLEAKHRVRLVYSRGQILPWPGAASSKVLLAFALPAEQASLMGLLVPTRYTRHTVPSLAALGKAMKAIVKDGFA